MPDIYVCYLSVSATFHGFKKKKNIISGQGACFTIEYQCSWTSDVGTELSEENSLKKVIRIHQDSSSVVQVSDSIKYKQPKKQQHL